MSMYSAKLKMFTAFHAPSAGCGSLVAWVGFSEHVPAWGDHAAPLPVLFFASWLWREKKMKNFFLEIVSNFKFAQKLV